jgi:hypothetical protein
MMSTLLNSPHNKLLTLYVLLMHVIEHYFNVNWYLIYKISNNAISIFLIG